MLNAEDLTRITWECVHFAASSEAAAALAQLPQMDVEEFVIDAAAIDSSNSLFRAVALQMRFPPYFGMNWDALDECLRDMSWLQARGYALVVQDAGQLIHRSPRVVGRLIEVWLGAAENWGCRGIPFHLVFVW